MAPTKHSQFSASSSARLLACPGSFKAGNDLDTGARSASVYSAEGTLAHAVSEACIFAGQEPADFLGQTRTADGFTFTINDEFVDAVQVYVDFVRGLRAMGFAVALETVVSPTIHWTGLKPLPIDLFGTSDAIAFNPWTGEVVIGDLKFGKGVAVEVVDNSQLKYYGAGSLDPDVLKQLADSLGYTGPITVKSVKLVIVQPRAIHPLGPVRSADYTAQQIVDWARNDLYKGVETALADGGKTFVPGKHCKFCPVAAAVVCDTLQEYAFEAARKAFAGAPLQNIAAADEAQTTAEVGSRTDAELADLMDRLEVIRPVFDAVQKVAQERAEQGKSLKGWKLVPKRSLRRWADNDNEILKQLDGRISLNPNTYSERALFTPAQVEKRVGKKLYDQVIAALVVKSSSGNTLAPEGDPRGRVAVRTAAEVFNSAPVDPNDW